MPARWSRADTAMQHDDIQRAIYARAMLSAICDVYRTYEPRRQRHLHFRALMTLSMPCSIIFAAAIDAAAAAFDAAAIFFHTPMPMLIL